MVREIIQVGDKKLKSTSTPVPESDIASKPIQQLIQDMLDTCEANGDETAGLSAVQIGELAQIYIVRRLDLEEEEWEVMINPQVTVTDHTPSVMWEGCLSVGEGDKRLFGPVSRPRKVTVSYLSREGKRKTAHFQDYMAHIAQHEQDHLNGKLFLQYITDPETLWTSAQLDTYLEKYGHYPPANSPAKATK